MSLVKVHPVKCRKAAISFHPVKSDKVGVKQFNRAGAKLFNRVKKSYLLYVGNAYPHKNLERLLQAFKVVLKERPGLTLVLVGKIDYFYQRLQKTVKELGLENKIVFTGQISDQKLKHLYQNGLAYVFPSLIEGFGLPGLEAMKQGLPVVCSNQGSLPEIYDQAAVYFNPKDIKEIAMMILKVVNNQDLRIKLKKMGELQVEKYSWQKCAQQTLKVYENVL